MSKYNDIKIPDSIDEATKSAIKRGTNYKKKRKYKKIMIASISTIMIGTGIVGVGIMNPSIADSIPMIKKIIDYFNDNNESLYKSDKEQFEKLGVDVNLKTKDKGIEFTLDSSSIDDNYLTIFYTIKSDKNIKEMKDANKNAYFGKPFIDAYIDGKNIRHSGTFESEGKFSSDNELKGMDKIDVSYIKIDDNMNVKFETDKIFGINGNWSISTKIDKSKAAKDTYRYELDKDFVLNKTDNIGGKEKKVKNHVNIERVIISPLANKIVINEKIEGATAEWDPSTMSSSLALFDQDGKSLDVIGDGGSGSSPVTGVATNSIEFLKGTKNTKSLTLVPFGYDESIQDVQLEPKSIENLPIEFETSKYGKVILEDIKITDKEIRYTYYKDGVVPNAGHFSFFDKDKKEIIINGGNTRTAIDRKTGRYTAIWEFENYNTDTSKFKDIKSVSAGTDNSIKLLYDQQMKINLVK